ncbi:MAG: phosphotransferase [Rhodospirillaceae bacterium]|nr:phosphotransferase [Rhodospirillaceae bacterium]
MTSTDDTDAAQAAIRSFLAGAGLMAPGAAPPMTALTGGVSSDIWRVELPKGPVCVKRALPRLKVAQVWEAPIERNRYEAGWMRFANQAVPGAAPALLAEDAAAGALAMAFLDPADHRLWKSELRDGRADPAFAAAVGTRLAAIHAASADRAAIAAAFPTDDIFYAIRLEPYLVATGRAHPDLAPQIDALVRRTAATKRALVHGDVSPKNILVGPAGPVFLDAECAWYGDPAFDIAFCLNHMLLKCLWTPRAAAAFLACYDALAAAYLAGVRWEAAAEIEARAASLLPALFLARMDGKSPVEYVTETAQKDRVRRVARPLIAAPPDRLARLRDDWAREIGI